MIYLALVVVVLVGLFFYWGSRTAKNDPSIHVCARELEDYIHKAFNAEEIDKSQFIAYEIALIFQKWNTSKNKTFFIVNKVKKSIKENRLYDEEVLVAILQMIQYGAFYHLEAPEDVSKYRAEKSRSGRSNDRPARV